MPQSEGWCVGNARVALPTTNDYDRQQPCGFAASDGTPTRMVAEPFSDVAPRVPPEATEAISELVAMLCGSCDAFGAFTQIPEGGFAATTLCWC